jgi:hypothetical protein
LGFLKTIAGQDVVDATTTSADSEEGDMEIPAMALGNVCCAKRVRDCVARCILDDLENDQKNGCVPRSGRVEGTTAGKVDKDGETDFIDKDMEGKQCLKPSEDYTYVADDGTGYCEHYCSVTNRDILNIASQCGPFWGGSKSCIGPTDTTITFAELTLEDTAEACETLQDMFPVTSVDDCAAWLFEALNGRGRKLSTGLTATAAISSPSDLSKLSTFNCTEPQKITGDDEDDEEGSVEEVTMPPEMITGENVVGGVELSCLTVFPDPPPPGTCELVKTGLTLGGLNLDDMGIALWFAGCVAAGVTETLSATGAALVLFVTAWFA